MNNLRDLVLRNRSYRRFDESHRISIDILRELIELALLTASAANRQPIKYLLSADEDTNALILPCLAWAGYLKDGHGPAPLAQGVLLPRAPSHVPFIGDQAP
jgi:nitroreductase